jgi:hypothetical protein
MHKHYAKDGVVCVSVSLDNMKDEGRALKFLQKQGATFPNYILDEPDWDAWQSHWKFDGPPAVFVFDRAGNKVGEFRNTADEHYTYEDVEKLVVKLLKANT